jgi:hypothetical protein
MGKAWAWVVAALLATGVVASTAGAGTVFRDTIHDEYAFPLEDFCDVPGLTVDLAGVLDMRVQVTAKGRAGLDYFLQHGVQNETLTANGITLTSVANVVEKDLHVTDNGDGTFTILIVSTGNAVLYGPDGKAIARNPGQLRIVLLVSDNGTPDDPFDDVTLDQQVARESTGRSDDYCEAAVPVLTGAST